MNDFVGAKFYTPLVLADSNQRIWIREKMLELFSTVSSTLSLYLSIIAMQKMRHFALTDDERSLSRF